MRRWMNSFFGKMMMFYTAIVLVSVAFVGYSYYRISEKMLIEQVTRQSNQTLDYIQNNMKMMIDQMISVVNMHNINDELQMALQNDYIDKYDRLKRISNVEKQLHYSNYAFDWMQQSITVIGKNGLVCNAGIPSVVNAKNIHSYQWYGEVKKNPTQINWYGPQIQIYPNNRHMISAIKILEMETFTDFYGIMILSVEEEAFFQSYKDKSNGSQGMIFIVDKEGNIISHSQRERVGKKMSVNEFLETSASRDEKIIDYNGKRHLYDYRIIKPTGWYVVQLIELKVLEKEVTLLRRSIVLIIIICLILAIIANYNISGKIAKPIIDLSRKIKNQQSLLIKESDLPEHGQYEISLLDKEYQMLIKKLEDTIHEMLLQQKEKRLLELEALQMQINPHFLYNTLNSIRMLVWTKQYEKIDPAILSLIHLLEQTINNQDELVTLKQEIENTKNYISIQKIRLQDAFAIEYSIDQDLVDYRVPKLILQPIVENAIFHGMKDRRKDGKIQIKVCKYSKDIKIEVEDNGPGMNKESIMWLLEGEAPLHKNRFSGIGIQNVNYRIQLFFGDDYGLNITSRLGEGTKVWMILPIIN